VYEHTRVSHNHHRFSATEPNRGSTSLFAGNCTTSPFGGLKVERYVIDDTQEYFGSFHINSYRAYSNLSKKAINLTCGGSPFLKNFSVGCNIRIYHPLKLWILGYYSKTIPPASIHTYTIKYVHIMSTCDRRKRIPGRLGGNPSERTQSLFLSSISNRSSYYLK
jgi:hypothetical protein